MAKLQLEPWQSFEIFSRIINKVEKGKFSGSQLSDFFDARHFSKKLKDYDDRRLCSDISLQMFGTKKDLNNNEVTIWGSGFYEFGRKIRLGEPVIIEDDMLTAMVNFVNKGIPRGNPDFLEVERRNYISPWFPSIKQSQFQQTNWWLYFYDRKYNENSADEFVDGVTKALLTFHPFGKAEIKSFLPNNNANEHYVGGYEVYHKDNKRLSLHMQLKNTSEKDLQILFYVGTDSITLSLGQYHNSGRSIYSGTVIMTKIQDESIDEENIGFYTVNHKKATDIPSHIWQYFKERKRNMIRTPCSITNENDFKRWLKEKNKPK